MDPLITSLLDLLFELREQGPSLTVGGGFGLFLKRLNLAETGDRTLLARLPEARATNDLDLFIRAEILADLDRTRQIAEAIRSLRYEPVEDAKFLQWKKKIQLGSVTKEVKIDLLVGPLGEYRNRLHIKGPRARPKGEIELHAHCTEEAIRIEEQPFPITVRGVRSNGEPHQATVFVPQAFPYLMMKLCAFDDRRNDRDKDVGRHHALDLYTIVGMMTEAEHEHASLLGREQAEDPHVRRARGIVAVYFSERTALGVLRLREHRLFREDFQIDDFIGVLNEVLPG
jgi:hypothetical protein